jgi:hypothetical protein
MQSEAESGRYATNSPAFSRNMLQKRRDVVANYAPKTVRSGANDDAERPNEKEEEKCSKWR